MRDGQDAAGGCLVLRLRRESLWFVCMCVCGGEAGLFGGGEKASLGTVEVHGSPGYLEDREKHPSFPGRLSKWWGLLGGLRGLSVTVTQGCAERAAMQGRGQGCVRMQVRQAAMWSGIFPTQL